MQRHNGRQGVGPLQQGGMQHWCRPAAAYSNQLVHSIDERALCCLLERLMPTAEVSSMPVTHATAQQPSLLAVYLNQCAISVACWPADEQGRCRSCAGDHSVSAVQVHHYLDCRMVMEAATCQLVMEAHVADVSAKHHRVNWPIVVLMALALCVCTSAVG